MSQNSQPIVIDGIKCYNPEVANSYADYPDRGFDLTDKDGDRSFWVRSRNRLLKSIVYNHLIPPRKTKFLEIGCGTGGFIQQIIENENLEITGSEIYLKGLLYAKNKLPDVDFIQFDVTQGVVGEEFDLIVAFDVIEHIEDDVAAISNINKMLCKDGIFIITVPQHKFLWSKLDILINHKRRYSRRDLVKKLQRNGFTISYCTSFLFILFPLMLIFRMFDRERDRTPSDEIEFRKRVEFSNLTNCLFDFFMRIDEALIRLGISLPFGGTLVIVAKKR